MRALVISILMVAACGGGKKDSTTPDESGDSEMPAGQETETEATGGMSSVDPSVVSNEQMEEISRLLDRRRPAVSRCLAFAVDNKDLPKNARGKITLQIVIQPSGKAGDVKILKQTVQSASLDKCVVDKVKEIPFPQIPKVYETTYTYGFEAL